MKIGEFREAVDSLNWNRRDLSGATRQEFVAMDVRARLERHIVVVTALLPLVHARFGDDLAHARSAIESAQATIVRWEGYRAEAQASPSQAGALFGALPRGRWPEPRWPTSWALRAGVGRVAQAGTTRAWSPTRCARIAQARDTPSALALTPQGRPSALRSASTLRCAG